MQHTVRSNLQAAQQTALLSLRIPAFCLLIFASSVGILLVVKQIKLPQPRPFPHAKNDAGESKERQEARRSPYPVDPDLLGPGLVEELHRDGQADTPNIQRGSNLLGI